MAKAFIPESILNAPKRPLHTPQREWLANELSGFVDDIIQSRKFRELGWFALKVVDKKWEKGRLHFVLLNQLGNAFVSTEIKEDMIYESLVELT